ncbi:hypothetical protein ACLKA6_011189 [Drosophila palustris]
MESALTGNTEHQEEGDPEEISPDVYAEFLQRHEIVLRDEATMLGFKAAIEANAELFRGATVLEVNCGSGILAMWAAEKGGAARVIAVEPSDVCRVARQLVRRNRLEHVVEVLQGHVEQLELPPVDIIMSKWMGACLMYSSALEDVLHARDKCLKPGGCIFPAQANLYMAAADQSRHPEDKFASQLQYWTRYSGLNLARAFDIAQQTPLLSIMDVNQMLTQRQLLQRFDMHTLGRHQLSFTVPFKLRSLRQSLAKYFEQGIRVSTSPSAPSTQWKQTLFPIDAHLPLCVGDVVAGQFRVQRHPRHLDFDIAWSCHNKQTSVEWHTQIYRMQGEATVF